MKIKHPTLLLLDEYKDTRTKVKLKCLICDNEFYAVPGSLHMGHGCPHCAGRYKTHDMFVNEMSTKKPHLLIIGTYKGSKVPIRIRCLLCEHEWETTPNVLLRDNKNGCPNCAGTIRKNTETFISEMSVIHPHIEVIGEYINNRTPIKCKCKLCGGEFYNTPHQLTVAGVGCPICKGSRGEKAIRDWLFEHNISFLREHRFYDCRDKESLPFDFYIPSHKTAIEYDGAQHYSSNDFFGGEKGFTTLKKHDSIKTEYCKNNGINLIRIPYFEYDNINDILYNELAI